MSSLDTNIAENFLFDSSVAKNNLDANNYVVKQRNISPIIDTQRGAGTYSSSKIIIDAQSFGNSSDVIAWSEAYITLPYRITLSASAGTTSTVSGAYAHNMLTGLKNNSLIESIRVEQAGRTIINESANLSHLINFIQHVNTTQESLESQTVVNAYYPDNEVVADVSASLQGVVNNTNFYNGTTYGLSHNDGLYKRQKALAPANQMESSGVFSDPANQLSEMATYQSVLSAPTSITTTGTTLSDIHFLAVIYLRDLSDYFSASKHPLSRGCSYKFTLTVNQATTVSNLTTTTTPFSLTPTITATNLTSGSTCQPAMQCIGPNTVVGNQSITASSATFQYTLTSAVDTTTDARQSGVILYVPSYILSEEYDAKLYSDPVIYRNPFVVNSAFYDSRPANAPINLQLFSAISNPRALIVIPQYGQSAQTQPSQCSPHNSCPGNSDPYLSLTKIQIRVNSRPVLPNNSNYGYQQFIDNTNRIFKLNGGESNMSSGIISMSKFLSNYRYYAFDLTSAVDGSQRDVPQLITFEGFNNSKVPVDLYVYVIYEQTATFDLLKGSVEIM